MDSFGWCEPFTLSEGITTRLAADHNDRVYVFWYMRSPHNGEFSYQYLENGVWSEIFCPFYNNKKNSVHAITADINNNLHCAGYHDPFGQSNIHPAYYRFDYSTQTWDYVTELSQSTSTRDIDIALDTAQLPHICFGGKATYHTAFNGEGWSIPDTIAFPDPYRVVIEVDKANKIHIATTEKADNGIKLVYYHKPDGSNWESMIVDHGNNVIFTPEFKIFNNLLYVVYDKSNIVPHGDIYISKLDILSITFEYASSDETLIEIYPNPFGTSTCVSYFLRGYNVVRLYIRDLDGKHIKTLVAEDQTEGNYMIFWDGTNDCMQRVPRGIYFCILTTNKHKFVKNILYLP
jgi:hypothetical protein